MVKKIPFGELDHTELSTSVQTRILTPSKHYSKIRLTHNIHDHFSYSSTKHVVEEEDISLVSD